MSLNIPQYMLDKLNVDIPFIGVFIDFVKPFIIGLLHRFPPCCVLEYSIVSFCEWLLSNRWQGWMYNENRHLQYCLFHSRKLSKNRFRSLGQVMQSAKHLQARRVMKGLKPLSIEDLHHLLTT